MEAEHLDRGGMRGSSAVAAGMLSPVTGKAMNPSWRVAEFLEDARALADRSPAQNRVRFFMDEVTGPVDLLLSLQRITAVGQEDSRIRSHHHRAE